MENKSKTDDPREIFLCSYIFHGRKTFFLSEQGEWFNDTFLTMEDGTLLLSDSIASMKRYIRLLKIVGVSWKDPEEVDLDLFQKALGNLRPGRASSKQTCCALLDGWNFLQDLAFSLNIPKEDRLLDGNRKTYEKIFYGNNLPSMTPPGKEYSPIWSIEEIALLQEEVGAHLKAINEKAPYVLVGTGAKKT